MDYADPKGFENILLKKVERIEAKQDAASIDVATALKDIYETVDKLIELNDVNTAVNVGRAFLNQKDYDKSLQVFQHILDKVSPSNQLYYKITANTAYSLIGKNEYDAAIENLLKVKSIKGSYFGSWHSLALAYAYFKLGKKAEYRRYLNQAKKLNEDEYELDIDFFARLYPEIEDDIRELWE
jgi:tetratricopeptide (TPR) repeat protein